MIALSLPARPLPSWPLRGCSLAVVLARPVRLAAVTPSFRAASRLRRCRSLLRRPPHPLRKRPLREGGCSGCRRAQRRRRRRRCRATGCSGRTATSLSRSSRRRSLGSSEVRVKRCVASLCSARVVVCCAQGAAMKAAAASAGRCHGQSNAWDSWFVARLPSLPVHHCVALLAGSHCRGVAGASVVPAGWRHRCGRQCCWCGCHFRVLNCQTPPEGLCG